MPAFAVALIAVGLGTAFGRTAALTAGTLTATELWYLAAVHRQRWALGPRPAAAFSAGVATAAMVLLPPFDGLADRAFAAHMLQHLVLIFVTAPLLMLGNPGLAIGRSVPPRMRRTARPVLRAAFRCEHRLADPRAAFAVFSLGLWLWHIPALFELAGRLPAVHVAEHATFVLVGAAFTAPLFARRPSLWVLPFLFATAMEGTLLGALLTFSGQSWYASGGPGFAGLTALQDQQIGGALMCLAGGVVTLAYGSWAFLAWAARQPIPEAPAPADHARPEFAR